ncbi:MAG: flagellar M-ring protein FliF, partial [Lachnospiraceae bacterium]|nr:flagellar M-ring protein FliF [Lachnospiraceae bacterium]
MADRVKELLGRVQEWWNKFTSKQKTIVVGSAAAVVLAFVILMTVLSQTRYTLLKNCETTKEASEITGLLEASGVTYKVSDDGLRIEVDEDQISTANLLLGANGYASAEYSIDNVTDGGFSTTESDKQKKYIKYLEKRMSHDFIGMFPAIKSAEVIYNIPENDGTMISIEQDSYATVVLEIDGEFTTDNAAFLAKAIATSLGNDTTENVTILDQNSNLLYSGEDNYSVGGAANT